MLPYRARCRCGPKERLSTEATPSHHDGEMLHGYIYRHSEYPFNHLPDLNQHSKCTTS